MKTIVEQIFLSNSNTSFFPWTPELNRKTGPVLGKTQTWQGTTCATRALFSLFFSKMKNCWGQWLTATLSVLGGRMARIFPHQVEPFAPPHTQDTRKRNRKEAVVFQNLHCLNTHTSHNRTASGIVVAKHWTGPLIKDGRGRWLLIVTMAVTIISVLTIVVRRGSLGIRIITGWICIVVISVLMIVVRRGRVTGWTCIVVISWTFTCVILIVVGLSITMIFWVVRVRP